VELSRRLQLDGDGSGLGVVVEELGGRLAAPAGLFVAAEGERGVEDGEVSLGV
jgi:hypothetical protein